ncbi:MAG TPA: Npt1/Npt2 family nucleotide transporter, partial [Gammaproteobacteria bacterium]|nr:Npt1/Npt2 family nucleotide transporter [Gammaproteobacteria bacterium]
LFATVLYPWHDAIHPASSATWLQTTLPDAFYDVVNVYRYWVFSVFYVMSELWGSAVSAFLFWQFANSIVEVNEAKRFYAHFYLLANLAVAYSGQVSKYFSNLTKGMPDQDLGFGITINYIIAIFMVLGVVTLVLYWYMNRVVLPDPELVNPSEIKSSKKSLKMGVWDSIKFILSSKYLLLIALLVVSYGIAINLIEVAWKDQAQLYFPSRQDYQAFMGNVTTANSLMTFAVILVGGALMRWLGWCFAALITPVFIGVTGAIFYYCVLFPELGNSFIGTFDISLLYFIVILGAVQNVLSKSAKYALFDPTKEMSYIPLDEESKMKGKAAVDVVGGRLGKAGGAYIQQFMFAVIGVHSVSLAAPYFAGLMLVIVVIWVFAVFALNTRFKAAQSHPAWQEKTQTVAA